MNCETPCVWEKPDCSSFKVEKGRFKIKGYDGPTLECDKCGSEMQLKTGRSGNILVVCQRLVKTLANCLGVENRRHQNGSCSNARARVPKSGRPLRPQGRRKGLFLAASGFPKTVRLAVLLR